jgi:hypothetical protein
VDCIYPTYIHYQLQLSDNLYSRWRRTCTSHVHGVVHRQYLHRALGALGQSTIKNDQDHQSINPFHQWTALYALRDNSTQQASWVIKTWPVYTRRISIITAIALELLHEYNSIRYKYILYNLYISAIYTNI